MERHRAANQTVIQLEKTLTDNTDTGAVPRWYDTTAHYQTYIIGQIFKQLHDKEKYITSTSKDVYRRRSVKALAVCMENGLAAKRLKHTVHDLNSAGA